MSQKLSEGRAGGEGAQLCHSVDRWSRVRAALFGNQQVFEKGVSRELYEQKLGFRE